MEHKPPIVTYILPNLFTAGSIFVGFFSIVNSYEHQFVFAAWLVFLSLLLDGLDGRVARLTNTTSSFGLEFDSLADIVAFGVAPAIMLYLYVAQEYDRIGIAICAIFIIFGAIRLARFNVVKSAIEPNVFIGLPIPMAAILLSCGVVFFESYRALLPFKYLLLYLALLLSVLMVSNIRYPSFKTLKLKSIYFMRVLTIITVTVLVGFVYPLETFMVFSFGYMLYGPLRAIFYMVIKR